MNIYKANLAFTPTKDAFQFIKNGYIAVEEGGVIEGVYHSLPEQYKDLKVIDYENRIMIPGFVDLHMHPNQYPNNGLGYDLELMPWIDKYATPSENYFKNDRTARLIYETFINDLWRFGITRTVQFGPKDVGSNDLLFELMLQSGLSCYLGKNHTDSAKDSHGFEDTGRSQEEAMYLYEKYKDSSELVHYILTPSFVPGCTEAMMKWVGDTARRLKLPVQSHLDENRTEIQLVKLRFPESKSYSDVYFKCRMFGRDIPTIMAHCVHTTEEEIQLLKSEGIYVAHCVHSNLDLGSGIMPLRRYLDEGIKVGLGSDISGGHTMNMMDLMRTTVEASKILFVYGGSEPVTTSEVFYLATKGGGEFFGKVGSFEKGYVFDALVIDDDMSPDFISYDMKERMERFIYLGDDRQIKERYCNGVKLQKPCFKSEAEEAPYKQRGW